MRITFHIGTFKTGTTTLQHTLDANKDALRAQGILYPGSARKFRGRRDNRHIALSHLPDGSPKQSRVFNRVFREIRNSGAHHTVLSSESWTDLRNFPALSRFVCRARNEGYHVDAALFLRNRYMYARSHYREWTQNWNNRKTFARYVTANADAWDYASLARRVSELFDRHVWYVNFDKIDDSVRHFTNHYNLPDLPALSQRNPSLNALETELHRLAHLRGIRWPADLGQSADILGPSGLWDKRDNYSEDLNHAGLALSEQDKEELAFHTGFDDLEIKSLLSRPLAATRPITEISDQIAETLDTILTPFAAE